MVVPAILGLVAIILFAADRAFGLSYLLAGCAVIIAVIAVALALGFSLDDIEPFTGILTTLVFTPIVIRLWFVREIGMARPENVSNGQGAATRPRDRKEDIILENAPRVLSVFKTFTFFFVLFGLFAMLVTTSVSDNPDPARAGFITAAAAYLTSTIAERYGASGVWQILWGAFGLMVIGPILLVATIFPRLLGWLNFSA